MAFVDDIEDENTEVVPLDLPLDRDTIAWLARLSRVTGTHPRSIVASMLRDIRVDDETADPPEEDPDGTHRRRFN